MSKILIVEDEKSLVIALKEKIVKEEMEAIVAKNGKEGLDLALREHPDLILLDIVMPVMDGITMLKKLRNDKWGRDVPVIILTNLSDAQKVAEGIDQNVCGYLVKSDWKIEEVMKKIKEALSF